MSHYDCSLQDLLQDLEPLTVHGSLETLIRSVNYDSRDVRPGSLFVALKGGYTDGHRFLTQALRSGASAALVEEWSDEAGRFEAAAVVHDTRASLAQVARRFYRDPGASLGVIGVTGTDGKTTTTFLIDAILRRSGARTGLIGTVSVRIADETTDHDTRQTTPESLEIQHLLAEMRDAGVNWAVLEATSHGLVLHRLDTCPFDIGVVTNITHEHLDFHGSVEAYREAKARLLEFVAAGSGRPYPRGIVLNADDEGARSIASHAGHQPLIWYGIEDRNAYVRAENIVVTIGGTSFDLIVGDTYRPVHLKLIGTYNVYNSLAAAGAAVVAGYDISTIAAGLESLESVPGRLARIQEGQPFDVFVDYAHTPDSIEKTIRLLRSLNSGRIIVVFGSAGERDRAKTGNAGRCRSAFGRLCCLHLRGSAFRGPERDYRRNRFRSRVGRCSRRSRLCAPRRQA